MFLNPNNIRQSPQKKQKIFSRLQADCLEDEYQILEEIGRGSFAHVIKVRERKGKNEIRAIKRIIIDPLMDQIRELETLKKIRSDHIIQFYGYIIENNQLNMIMKMAKGSLRDQMVKTKQFPPEKLLSLIIQVTSAMLVLNQKNIMHLDLKPENILYEGDSYYKLCDFGCSQLFMSLSKASPNLKKNPNVASNLMVDIDNFQFGTPAYIAPQIQLGRSEIGKHSCDIWSFGIILYQIQYKKLPFPLQKSGRVPDKIFQQILSNKQSIILPQSSKAYPADLIGQMLKSAPKDRISWRKLKESLITNYKREQAQFWELRDAAEGMILMLLVFSNVFIFIADNCDNNVCEFWANHRDVLEKIREILIYLGEAHIAHFHVVFSYKFQKLPVHQKSSLSFILQNYRKQKQRLYRKYAQLQSKHYRQLQQLLRENLQKLHQPANNFKKDWQYVRTFLCFIEEVQKAKALFCQGALFKDTCAIFDIRDTNDGAQQERI